ncbi:Protein Y66D12A.24 [Aphelenchoides avenae]|nr:Protein Y66D12A.24 [Aphelenchus avenae]
MPNHYVPEKQRMYGGSVYQAAPQAPTLEIKINQNNSPAPSVYSEANNGYSRHPAPSVPPPPPPPMTHPSTESVLRVTKKLGNQKLYVAHLTLSIVAIMVCIVGCISSGYNWSVIGTYHHPKISRDHAFCLMGEHDAPRISYIFSHMDQYNFRKCLFELKLGLAVNTFHFVISAVIALLNLGSVYLCVKKVCNW